VAYGYPVTVDDRGEQFSRKVRTPHGGIPRRTRGRQGQKPRSTESVTENKPPAVGIPKGELIAGKGEKAG